METFATSAFEMAEHQMPMVVGLVAFRTSSDDQAQQPMSCAVKKSRKLQLFLHSCSAAVQDALIHPTVL
jgi:hypothetical protein